ncbi:MAG: type IIL restriction-modification enzyme MmeI [Burkholderiaceae bacterium]
MGAHNTATGASALVDSAAAQDFIARWSGTTASELATAQSFVIDLCALLGMAKPHPTPEQDYMFERPVTFTHGDGSTSAGRIDCYRRGHFVLEAKKLKAGSHTKGFDDGLLRARSQGEAYARALPAHEGRPPFVLVVDVGTVIEVYAEFSKTGGTYTPYPDPRSHRLQLADLARPEVQDRLRRIWQDPDSLNPARISAQVTRDVAALLAQLAKSLENGGNGVESGHNRRRTDAHQSSASSSCIGTYLTRFRRLFPCLPKTSSCPGQLSGPAANPPRRPGHAAAHAAHSVGRHGPGRLLRRAGQRSAALQLASCSRAQSKTATACGSLPHRSTCSLPPRRPTGARSSPPSSAPCSNARSTPLNATPWAPTTRSAARASSAWCCPL